MSKGITNKTRLLLGASTLFVIVGAAGMVHAADVQVAGVVTLSADAAQSQDQSNTKAVTATSTGANTTATTGAITGSSATVDANRSVATAIANTGTLSLGDTDSAASATSVALGTVQSSTGASGLGAVAVAATTLNTDVLLTTGATSGSKVTLSNSVDAASATANSALQTVVLESTTLTLGATSAAADTVGAADVDATGAVVLGSRQTTTFTQTVAFDSGSTFTLAAGAVTSSDLDLIGNSQNANATGSTATNAIDLSGTTVGIGLAIASQQDSDAGSPLMAGTTASAFLTATSVDTGSTATVSGNLIQAKALSANTSNAISVDATSVALANADATAGGVINSSGDATVSGAFATVNDQSVLNSTTATVDAEARGLVSLDVAGAVTGGSALVNDANTISARAQAAVTTNTTNLNIGGTLSSGTAVAGGVANGAVIANLQSIGAGAGVLADVDGAAIDMVKTTVGGALTASSISTSANRIQAFADGAVATNNLAVSATTISAAANATGVPKVGTTAAGAVSTADTAFAVANAQISGSQNVNADINDPATISSLVTGATSDSNVSLNGNVIDAFGTSNKATNGVSLTGTSIATDAGVLNVQSSDAQVISRIGSAPAGAATRADAGVIAEFDANVSGSAVAVNSNVTRGSAIGNVANNSLAVNATTLSGGGTAVQAAALGDVTGVATATGDYSLANSQSLLDASTSDTAVAATYGIDIGLIAGAAATNSRLSVSSNNQFAEALGNSGTNRIALTATGAGASGGVDPTAALSNVQDGNAAEIATTSKMTVFANAESSGSSVAINGNSNTALGVVNNAVNSIGVSAVTLDGAAAVGGIVASSNTTTADYALNSVQGASGSALSTARSDISNLDTASANNTGIVGSVITMTGNATTAEGSANRISNQVSVSATDNGATAALNSSQTSAALVISTATSTAGYALTTADAVINANASSISVDGNSTMALARGNSASNALNYNVGASYTGNTGATITGVASVGATAAVLNAQTNSGAVTAISSGTSYSLALNSGTGAAALNSNATLANNSAAASAFGNVSTSSLNMTTFGAGVPSSALASNQVNQGVITATANNVSFGMTVGTTSGSALRVGGNNTTAQAVANSSVNSMNGGN
jgi:hypothetical protein